jgi:trehalose 6-phosphate synthase/phosphatase
MAGMSNRLLIVSSRLPVSVQVADGQVRVTDVAGGLASGLRPWQVDADGLWLGWPGDLSRLSVEQRAELDQQLHGRAIVPVHLPRDHADRYHHGFASRVLWPLLHYLVDRVPVDAAGWDAYRQVNEAFADAVAREYRPGDLIWVHDYPLMLVPALLRERLPEAHIGFFLHVPFPSSEVFRILPWRHDILHGLLGADLVGFHTFAYMRHFVSSLLHVEGAEADIDRVRVGGREVRFGAFPMGVDAGPFAELGGDPDVVAEADAIRREAGGRQIVLGVDRLDDTTGIPRRLQAIERLLARDPGPRDTMRYIQVAVPSRGEWDAYQRFRQQVEKGVGAINGTYGTLRSAPVHYIHRSVSMRQLVALYRAADVMLVTPLRDGMNLVAKEFAASRVDEDGVLVLSEFAGAAAELDGAVIVNPYDVEAVASGIRRALAMPAGERRARMKALRRRVTDQDVHAWAGSFIDGLSAARAPTPAARSAPPGPSLVTVLSDAQRSTSLHLLLDYDGTLVPLARTPELAAPDDEVLSLIQALAAAPRTRLDIVSGRPHETLEAWFGPLPVTLWAEHGFWHRTGPDGPWQPATAVAPESLARILPILEQFTASTPGSHIETKSASIAWHYRRADRDFGVRQAYELRMLLGDALSNQPFEVLEGHKVIEVRLRGISKAVVGHRLQAASPPGTLIVAIGDDRTDEDLFAALPPSSLTVAVGRRPTRAKFRVDDYRAVRRILQDLLAEARTDEPDWGARVGESALRS